MADRDRRAAPRQPSGDVHEAAEVAREHQLGTGGGDVGCLVVDHFGRDLRVLDAEGAAEAAAHLGAGQLDQLETAYALQQAARLLLDAELAQAGAGIVVSGPRRAFGINARHPDHVGEEADQLVGTSGELACPLAVGGTSGKQLRVVLLEHARTRARRHHDVVVALERVDGLARQLHRIGAVALVVRRLTAAGLCARHGDRAAGVLEQLHRREADRWPEQIDQAGHEQRDVRRFADGSVLGSLRIIEMVRKPQGWAPDGRAGP